MTSLFFNFVQTTIENIGSRQKFCGLYEECLDSLSQTFPECELTKNALLQYRSEVKNNTAAETQFIKMWHKHMKPFYAMADEQDMHFWEQPLPFLSSIKLIEKIRDSEFSTENVDILWEYVKGMNCHARICNVIPEGLLERAAVVIDQHSDQIMSYMTQGDYAKISELGLTMLDSVDRELITELKDNLLTLVNSFHINSIEDVIGLVEGNSFLSEILKEVLTNGEQGNISNMCSEAMKQVVGNPHLMSLMSNINMQDFQSPAQLLSQMLNANNQNQPGHDGNGNDNTNNTMNLDAVMGMFSNLKNPDGSPLSLGNLASIANNFNGLEGTSNIPMNEVMNLLNSGDLNNPTESLSKIFQSEFMQNMFQNMSQPSKSNNSNDKSPL